MKHLARARAATIPLIRSRVRGWVASTLQMAAVVLVVAFAGTFGTRWALLAAAAGLLVLSLALDGDRP